MIWAQPISPPPGIVTWPELSQWDPFLRFCTMNQQHKTWRKTWGCSWVDRGAQVFCTLRLWLWFVYFSPGDGCELSEPSPQCLQYVSLCVFGTTDLCGWQTRNLKWLIPGAPSWSSQTHEPELTELTYRAYCLKYILSLISSNLFDINIFMTSLWSVPLAIEP